MRRLSAQTPRRHPTAYLSPLGMALHRQMWQIGLAPMIVLGLRGLQAVSSLKLQNQNPDPQPKLQRPPKLRRFPSA